MSRRPAQGDQPQRGSATELKKDPYFCTTCRHEDCVCWPSTPEDEGR